MDIWSALERDQSFRTINELRQSVPADRLEWFDILAEHMVTAYQTNVERGIAAYYAAGADRTTNETFEKLLRERFIESAAEFARLRRKHGVGWARLPEVHRRICDAFRPE